MPTFNSFFVARNPVYADTDFLNYANRVSGLSARGRVEVSKFIKRLKDDSLWDDLTYGVTLRSHQNQGNGTTLYPIKNTPTLDGTLNNGSLWDTNGIRFNGSNQNISLTNPNQSDALTAYSLIVVFHTLSTKSQQCLFGGQGAIATVAGPSIFVNESTLQGASANSIKQDLSATADQGATPNPPNGQIGTINTLGRRYSSAITNTSQMVCATASVVTNTLTLEYNLAARQSQSISADYVTIWNNAATWRIGSRQNDSYSFDGIISACFYYNAQLTAAQYLTFYNAYKETLGVGLPLP